MSSSPPAAAAENNEVVETMDTEAPRPGHAVESAGTEVDQAGAAANHDGPDEYEDIDDDEYDGDDIASDEEMYDDDNHFGDEGGKFSKSAEVEAMVEALWRKVVAVDDEKTAAGHACSVCMEHLTCEGAHRICCIPCGHVYGRSCLESWLRRNGNETARCPQCAMMFADNHIIDLHAPANLGEGCGRLQGVKVHVTKAMAEVEVQCKKQMEATRARARSKITKLYAEQRSCDEEVWGKLSELKDIIVETWDEWHEQMQSLNAAVDKASAGMNYIFDVKCAEIDKIKQHIAADKLSLPPAKPAELQEEGTPV